MGKHKQRTYKEKQAIVQEILNGNSYFYVSEKYDVLPGTIANWKRKYIEGTLNVDRRGRKSEEVEDIEIIKKCYALLLKIRKTQPK